MNIVVRFVEKSLSQAVDGEPDPINRARIRIILLNVIAYILFSIVMSIAYAIEQETYQLLRTLFSGALFIVFFKLITVKKIWRSISHIVTTLVVINVWVNIFFYVQGINVPTLQYVWLATLLSFFMYGLKWGGIYSFLSILPILLYTFFADIDFFYFSATSHPISKISYSIVICYNFIIIILFHYYFFKAYNKVFEHLNRTKNDLNILNESLKEDLSDVNKMASSRMDFLSTMSHELRTPLNGVIGMSNVLLSQNPREDQKENLNILKFSVNNLLSLINNVLDFNKLDGEKVVLESVGFNLNVLLKNVYESVKIRAEEKGLICNLSVSEDLHDKQVYGDPTRLTQVLFNLLGNAIKFTNSGFVNLTCKQVRDLDGKKILVRFVVEDSGIGIEKNRQETVFDTFMQATESTNRIFGGSGLGLSIVKKVLALYKSKVILRSEIGKGTNISFDIHFPYSLSFDKNVKSKFNPQLWTKELSQLKVLVAEDNYINVLVVKKILLQQNIVPDIAENGVEALKLLDDNNYDIILMDLHMPEMDGNEAIRQIRSLNDNRKANTPIIALTATVSSQILNMAKEAGMTDYLVKPFHSDDLFEKIYNLTFSSYTEENLIETLEDPLNLSPQK